jgi:exodeoxyribonuclease V gamma subunit
LSLKTIRRELGAWLRQQTPPLGFLRRGVTFTELVPLRSVPFEVVCLVGMNENAFPRADDRPSFDRTRERHRPGDRNKRDDDRHSFLQALLCARQRLVITYTAPASSDRPGQNASTVVLELRDAVNEYYTGDGALLDPVLHPLHAFDSGYFDGSSLPRSFSDRYAELARIVERPRVQRPSVELLAPHDLESGEGPEPALHLSELSRWLWNPSEAFIADVLRARFGVAAIEEPSTPLTELSSLDESRVGREALGENLSGAALRSFLRASPEFPDGSWGASIRAQLGRELESVQRVIRAAEAKLGGEGRVLVRYSGTERKARVMIEGPEGATIKSMAEEIAAAIVQACGGKGAS